MFDIGFWEIIIITVVALLVVGPERLPGLAREIGRFVGKTRRFINSVRSDIEQELQTEELRKMLNEQDREIRELRTMMQDTEDSLRHDLKETESALKETEAKLKEDIDFDTGLPISAHNAPGLNSGTHGSAPNQAVNASETGKASHTAKAADTPAQVRRVPVSGTMGPDLITDPAPIKDRAPITNPSPIADPTPTKDISPTTDAASIKDPTLTAPEPSEPSATSGPEPSEPVRAESATTTDHPQQPTQQASQQTGAAPRDL